MIRDPGHFKGIWSRGRRSRLYQVEFEEMIFDIFSFSSTILSSLKLFCLTGIASLLNVFSCAAETFTVVRQSVPSRIWRHSSRTETHGSLVRTKRSISSSSHYINMLIKKYCKNILLEPTNLSCSKTAVVSKT